MAGFDLDAGNPGRSATLDHSGSTSTTLSAAAQRFHTCRWRKPAEAGVVDHCTHRDVLPMTGTSGFEADAWCQECGYYKIKRIPRKRPIEERFY